MSGLKLGPRQAALTGTAEACVASVDLMADLQRLKQERAAIVKAFGCPEQADLVAVVTAQTVHLRAAQVILRDIFDATEATAEDALRSAHRRIATLNGWRR